MFCRIGIISSWESRNGNEPDLGLFFVHSLQSLIFSSLTSLATPPSPSGGVKGDVLLLHHHLPFLVQQRRDRQDVNWLFIGEEIKFIPVKFSSKYSLLLSSLSLRETTTDKERSDRRFLSLDCHPLFPYLLLLSWCCKDAYTTTTGRSYHWKQQQVHTLNISHREWIRRRHWKETGNECDSWGFFRRENHVSCLLLLFFLPCIIQVVYTFEY